MLPSGFEPATLWSEVQHATSGLLRPLDTLMRGHPVIMRCFSLDQCRIFPKLKNLWWRITVMWNANYSGTYTLWCLSPAPFHFLHKCRSKYIRLEASNIRSDFRASIFSCFPLLKGNTIAQYIQYFITKPTFCLNIDKKTEVYPA